ncbi:transcriptional regulator, LacI family [Micrococcales bacterium KH10]|nr:transcriptional regulator, LacI family [Micrococcales bacterium KH10]
MAHSRQGRPDRSGRRSASMADVAALAGVSMQTVSRVANSSLAVRTATRDRVIAAMRELGYVPNAAARALKSGTFRNIGIIAHQLGRAGESQTVVAVASRAYEKGYSISLVDIEAPLPKHMSAAVHHLRQQSVDGLVVIRAEMLSDDELHLPAGLPTAVFDSRLVGKLPAVVSDQVSGTADAVQHLLDLGHRTVHHVAGPTDSIPAIQREQTWRQTLLDAGVATPDVLHTDWSAAEGYLAGQKLAADPQVTAVFCANDQIALGVIRAMFERRRCVPDEVSVVGFDDLPESEFAWPPLTTVRQDYRTIGAELITLLFDQLEHPTITPQQPVTVPTRLIVRASTAPPRATAK